MKLRRVHKQTMKNKRFSKANILREQWLEDGREMGKLKLALRFLARQLAMLGARSSGLAAGASSSFDVDRLQAEWFAAGYRAADSACGDTNGRRN